MFRKILVAAVASLSISGVANAQGIPVYDNAAQLQWVQQVVTTGQQLIELKNQLEQAKRQFDSLHGLRDVANLLGNELVTQVLTPDQRSLLSALQGRNVSGTLAGISGTLKEIQQKNAVVSCQNLSSNPASQAACDKQWQQVSMSQYTGQSGYEQASKNIDNLQAFLDKIRSTPDAKGMQDLQARIQLEQVKQQNETAKLAMVAQMQAAQEKIDRMNSSASTQKMLTTGGGIRF